MRWCDGRFVLRGTLDALGGAHFTRDFSRRQRFIRSSRDIHRHQGLVGTRYLGAVFCITHGV